MENIEESRKIYIVISQTGTVLSRILKVITGAEYNHVSLCLSRDLELMYSFGRKNPYNPFYGGFVLESPNFGTFKRFVNTKVKVISIDVDEETYDQIKQRLEYMLLNKNEFGYNYLGLYLAALKIRFTVKNRYFCSEFVKDVLLNSNITDAACLVDIAIPRPIDFLAIPNTNTVYIGKLQDYKLTVTV